MTTVHKRWSREAYDVVLGEVAAVVPHAIKRADLTLNILTELADAGLLPIPGTWSLPADPGPEVAALRDATGQIWHRSADDTKPGYWSWLDEDGRPIRTATLWALLSAGRGPLTDATGEPS